LRWVIGVAPYRREVLGPSHGHNRGIIRGWRGELIQIDGSDHHWFEGRAPRCTLLVFVDDATSRLTQLHFAESESTFSYFNALRGHLEAYGKPVEFYSDKFCVFRVNATDLKGESGPTQFARALSELNVDIICANTPAAKGRVERANLTLQDRLVRELRLQGISTIDDANAFAVEFIEDYNRRFGKMPHSDRNAHRQLLSHEVLKDICQWRDERKVSKQLSINEKRVMYLLQPTEAARKMEGIKSPGTRRRLFVHFYLNSIISSLSYRNGSTGL
jgi:hypothetical protein